MDDSDSVGSIDDVDFGTKMHVITLSFSDDSGDSPSVDLGDTNPWLAVSIFEMALESVRMVLVPPSVTYKDTVVFEVSEVYDDND